MLDHTYIRVHRCVVTVTNNTSNENCNKIENSKKIQIVIDKMYISWDNNIYNHVFKNKSLIGLSCGLFITQSKSYSSLLRRMVASRVFVDENVENKSTFHVRWQVAYQPKKTMRKIFWKGCKCDRSITGDDTHIHN